MTCCLFASPVVGRRKHIECAYLLDWPRAKGPKPKAGLSHQGQLLPVPCGPFKNSVHATAQRLIQAGRDYMICRRLSCGDVDYMTMRWNGLTAWMAR